MFELLEKIMEIRGVSLLDLTKNTSVSQQQFSNWKYKKSKPSTDTLIELAKFFEVPISYFFDSKLVEENTNFSNDDLLMARELNKSDKVELIKSIMKIQNEKDIQLIDMLTKKILETQK